MKFHSIFFGKMNFPHQQHKHQNFIFSLRASTSATPGKIPLHLPTKSPKSCYRSVSCRTHRSKPGFFFQRQCLIILRKLWLSIQNNLHNFTTSLPLQKWQTIRTQHHSYHHRKSDCLTLTVTANDSVIFNKLTSHVQEMHNYSQYFIAGRGNSFNSVLLRNEIYWKL